MDYNKKVRIPNQKGPNVQRLERLVEEQNAKLEEIDKLERQLPDRNSNAKQRLPRARLEFVTISVEIRLHQANEEGAHVAEWEGRAKLVKELDALSKKTPRNDSEFEKLKAEVIAAGNTAIEKQEQLGPKDLDGL
ncbi:hypothetical protein DL771_012274 [Monosporascus sp. 5C6A]|nr:hypothetical protein DL771_012274 [Monosporascus sp. 5C6A]